MQNKEIASLFKLLSMLMEIHGENPFKARSYANASFQIERLSKQLSGMDEKEVRSVQGIGDAIAKKIAQILDTGKLELLERFLQETPAGIMEMIPIKGMGPKKIEILWKKLGIESVGELWYACYENRLVNLRGFGEKTQRSIQKSIEFFLQNRDKYLYAALEREAQQIVDHIQQHHHIDQVSLTGDIRRKREIIEQIELLVGTKNNSVIDKLWDGKILILESSEKQVWNGHTMSSTPVTLYVSTPEKFIEALFLTTGSQAYISKVNQKKQVKIKGKLTDEHDIYGHSGLSYIEPEMREVEDGFDGTELDEVRDLIGIEDIKGIIHCHTHYSDGRDSLKDMVEHCHSLGYQYIGISDHSKSAVYAGGLDEKAIQEQHKEIDVLNKKFDALPGKIPFRILKGIESDILGDGSLDYPDDVLSQFDFVIASIHSQFKMDIQTATARIIKAVENRHTTILGHLTGRLLLSREGYPVDHSKIIDACAANGVLIELNANPNRLDMDWRWIPYAMAKNVTISINPDAHSKEGMHDVLYGVNVARKGGLTKAMTYNAQPLSEIASSLKLFL